MVNEIEVVVLKYESDYTKRRKDIKRHAWFSFPNDLLLHPDFTDISGDELKWFVWILSISSKIMDGKVRLNVQHGERILSLSRDSLFSMIEKLQGKQLDVASDQITATTRPQSVQVAAPTLHNITEHNKTNIPQSDDCGGVIELKKISESKKLMDQIHAEIEKAYKQIYPRKEGKTKGIKKLLKDIKTFEDVGSLRFACSNYAKSVAGKETQYIKHFETFASEWRDWLDPQAGQVIGVKPVEKIQPGQPKRISYESAEQVAQRNREADEAAKNSSGNPEIVRKALEQAKFLRGQK